VPTMSARISAPMGLHARPAGRLTAAVAQSGIPVRLATSDGKSVDAGSIIMVMSLGVAQGDVVELIAEDDGTADLLSDLVAILESAE